jgi:Ca-activated chloride channel family protein
MTTLLITPCIHITELPDPRGLGGLVGLAARGEQVLPLKEVKARARIVGAFCRTVIEQRFENTLDVPMEAVHIFPLPPDGAVVEMELSAGEVTVRAECKEKKEAEAVFAEARSAGHRAGLLTAERADVHTLRVTNLPPKSEVRVRIVVIEQLDAVDGRFKWRFPTVVAPRFMPGSAVGHEGSGVAADTDIVPDASRISPPIRLGGGVKLDLEVEIEGAVSALESALHAVRLDLGSSIRVAPSARAILNKDFILLFSTADSQKLLTSAWTDGRYTAVLVQPPAQAQMPALQRDAVFVVDISGSMGGTKMDAARRAITAALHGLMPGDRFRLIAFDDRVEHFRPDFSSYDDASLKAADTWIARLGARGGTVMLPAITAALDGNTPAGRLRTVLFITDGQAGDEDRLLPAVANRKGSGRFFTMGIDTAVNASLLTRLARVGGGTCELCTPSDDIEAAVVRLEARFGSPLLQDVVVEGGIAARPDPEVVFSGRPAAILVEGGFNSLKVRGKVISGEWSEQVSAVRVPEGELGALWGRARVSYLEDRLALKPFEEEAIRPEILRIALSHNLVSRFTAMVAVDRSVTVSGKAVEVVQPVSLPEGWDERFASGPVGAHGGGSLRQKTAAPQSLSAPRPAVAPAMAAPVRMGRVAARDQLGEAAPPPPAPPMEAADKAAEKAEPAPIETMKGAASGVMDRLRSLAGMPAKKREEKTRELVVYAPASSEMLLEQDEELERASKPEAKQVVAIDEAALGRSQQADGSFGGDIGRTAAVLVLLLLSGNTRRKGLRSRMVLKAAGWLEGHKMDARAALALKLLEAAERGESLVPDGGWKILCDGSVEGRALRERAGV